MPGFSQKGIFSHYTGKTAQPNLSPTHLNALNMNKAYNYS